MVESKIIKSASEAAREARLETAFDSIRDLVNLLEVQNARLREQLDMFNQNEEIQKYKNIAADIQKKSLMNMSDKEYEADKEFRSRHWEMHNGGKHKFVGNTYWYELSGTGIGTYIKIKCPICGEEKDITDIDSW